MLELKNTERNIENFETDGSHGIIVNGDPVVGLKRGPVKTK